MTPDYVLSRARLLLKLASTKKKSAEPVDDETWTELIELGVWAKEHALKPGLLASAIPARDAKRTWSIVEGSAQAIVKSLTKDA